MMRMAALPLQEGESYDDILVSSLTRFQWWLLYSALITAGNTMVTQMRELPDGSNREALATTAAQYGELAMKVALLIAPTNPPVGWVES